MAPVRVLLPIPDKQGKEQQQTNPPNQQQKSYPEIYSFLHIAGQPTNSTLHATQGKTANQRVILE